MTSGSRTRIDTREGTHEADWVIGADGANSLVRRSVALPFRRDQLSIATGFFASGTTSREIVIEMTTDPPGYIWSFPRPDHLAIGICAQADGGASAAMLRARTLQWIRTTGIAGDAPLHEYSWPIPSLAARDFGRLTLAGPRWSLTGDAAGLVDPITREGIFFAIASGEWSADAIVAGGPLETCRPHLYRARARRSRARPRARRATEGRFFSPGVRIANGPRAARERLDPRRDGRPRRGEQRYRTLKWRLAKTMEMRLAWKCLRRLKAEG
jgi:flavin-dependent dehydrogenase